VGKNSLNETASFSETGNDNLASSVENAIEVHGISYIYKNGSGISGENTFFFPKNRLIALTGISGCGKISITKWKNLCIWKKYRRMGK
jgi:ABC-type transport system involved in cytochrome bd biosynthesis fused ATPase/permease subunit